MDKNKRIGLLRMGLILCLSMFLLNTKTITAHAQTFVIDQNSTYVDENGAVQKHIIIENGRWIGFQGGVYLLETYGPDNRLKIIVPEGVTAMGCTKMTRDCENYGGTDAERSFEFCFPTEIVLPKSCKTINHMHYQYINSEKYPDSFCDSILLEHINLENVRYLNADALRGTSIGKMTNGLLDLSNAKMEMGYYSLSECDCLTKVIVGGQIKSVGEYSFDGCSNLTYVELKDGVKKIKKGAFGKGYKTIDKTDEAPNYKITVRIPTTVTKIENFCLGTDAEGEGWYNKKATIITPRNSYAYKWAKKNGIKVKAEKGITPSKVTNLQVSKSTETSITLTYTAGKNAQEYYIYQLKNGSYKKIGSTKKTSYKIKKLKSGKDYTFKVISINGGEKSAGVKIKAGTKTKAPKWKSITKKSTSVQLSWNRVQGAGKYEVYISKDKTIYNKIGTTSKTKYTAKKLKNGTYYFKIRTYRIVGKEKIYSDYSKVKKIIM